MIQVRHHAASVLRHNRFAFARVAISGIAVAWILSASLCHAQTRENDSVAPATARNVDFASDVLPLLQTYCIDCHGPEAAESELRLDSMASALRGGDSGEAAVLPGQSEQSYLLARVLHQDPSQRMPPDAAPLPTDAIGTLRAWIDDAAGWQAAELELASQKSQHWSFQPIVRPAVPVAASPHPIDAFVDTKLAAAQLPAVSTASRRTLIRRLFLVVHGLPPTPEQVDHFVGDRRGDAWERLVDQVLASPRYGERWATHWLDLVRFGETHGFETNRERPNAWPYRDWVVKALNDDQRYDAFIIEQLAGDALAADPATGFLVAGPYDLVKGQNPQLQLTQRQDELADMINTTGTAFLGLTLGCARCHNHKFDPITQTDYYAMQAVFAGVNHAERELPMPAETTRQLQEIDERIVELHGRVQHLLSSSPASERAPVRVRPAVNAQRNVESFTPLMARQVRFTILATNQSQACIDELEIFAGDENVALASAGGQPSSSGDFRHPLHKLEHINDGRFGNPHSWISSQQVGGWVQIDFPQARRIDRIVWGRDREGRFSDRLATEYRIEASLDGENWTSLVSSDDRHRFAAESSLTEVDFSSYPEKEAKRGRKLIAELKQLTTARDALAKPRMIYAGTFAQPGPTHRLYRGDPTAPREPVPPAAIAALNGPQLDAATPEQQRRLAIARWIAAPHNPLTARVIVNRLWQFHFGTGIVDTPSDFGKNGGLPTHPELLDWLACELVQSGWSLKHMHRLILTSATWQRDSRPTEQGLADDAGSRLLWRFPPRRLEAEGIRDCMLAVTDRLDLQIGGPGFSAFEVDLENVRHYFPKKDFGPSDWRRMIYMTKVRQERDAVFGIFDCPDFSQVVPQRSRSTTPLQALNLLNSRFVLQQAELLVTRLERDASTSEGKVSRAYELCFARRPTMEELHAALEFVDATSWQQFTRAMLNSNEFLFIP